MVDAQCIVGQAISFIVVFVVEIEGDAGVGVALLAHERHEEVGGHYEAIHGGCQVGGKNPRESRQLRG